LFAVVLHYLITVWTSAMSITYTLKWVCNVSLSCSWTIVSLWQLTQKFWVGNWLCKYRNKVPVYTIYCKPDILELVAPSFYIPLLRPFLHSQVFRQNPFFKMQTGKLYFCFLFLIQFTLAFNPFYVNINFLLDNPSCFFA